ncbi:MAG: hypothetical protein IJV08_02030 [Bacteroidaceae bacterium]|nr:hypothetical protein [Bacteroidaceae bacterium]
MMASAQVVNSVCGAKFGSSYSQVVVSLKNVYGMTNKSFYQEDKIMYFGKTFEGIFFDSLNFHFIGTDSNRQFNEAHFVASCETEEEARDMREKLIASMSKTFQIKRIQDDEGYVTYWGGLSPTDKSKYGFQIYISATGLDEYPYTLTLSFGPYDYR